MENQIKYWSDYTEFIKITEGLTGFSPSVLIDRYEILVKELETKTYFEWIYEDMQDEYTVQKVHKILHYESLKNNLLKDEFYKKIKDIDIRIKSFLHNVYKTDKNWWLDFKPDRIDW
jgi:hypothetical protein